MTETIMINEADQSAKACCSKKEKIPTQKDVIDAWLGVVILNIILGVLFPYVWWAWIPRIVVTVHAIELTVKYHDTKKASAAPEFTKAKTDEIKSIPVVVENTSIVSAHFCPNCGVQLNQSTKYCPYCGNAL